MEVLRRKLAEKLSQQYDWSGLVRGDFDLNPDWSREERHALTNAAVLVPVIARPGGATVLFTRRTEGLPSHAGQISLPGGRAQAGDAGPVHTALRETFEEVGLAPERVDIVGALDVYETRTGFRVRPVVGVVEAMPVLALDEREVAYVFEVPFDFLMDPANHQTCSVEWQGATRYYYAMPYRDHRIWGATAGMIKSLYDRLCA